MDRYIDRYNCVSRSWANEDGYFASYFDENYYIDVNVMELDKCTANKQKNQINTCYGNVRVTIALKRQFAS